MNLIVDLGLIDWWTTALGVPHNLVLVVQRSIIVSDRDDLGGVVDLFLRQTHWVAWNPEQLNVVHNTWCVVSEFFIIFLVTDLNVAWHKTTHSGVVVVDVWLEELGQEVWLLVRSSAKLACVAVDISVGVAIGTIETLLVVGSVLLQQATLLCFQTLWQIVN